MVNTNYWDVFSKINIHNYNNLLLHIFLDNRTIIIRVTLTEILHQRHFFLISAFHMLQQKVFRILNFLNVFSSSCSFAVRLCYATLEVTCSSSACSSWTWPQWVMWRPAQPAFTLSSEARCFHNDLSSNHIMASAATVGSWGEMHQSAATLWKVGCNSQCCLRLTGS